MAWAPASRFRAGRRKLRLSPSFALLLILLVSSSFSSSFSIPSAARLRLLLLLPLIFAWPTLAIPQKMPLLRLLVRWQATNMRACRSLARPLARNLWPPSLCFGLAQCGPGAKLLPIGPNLSFAHKEKKRSAQISAKLGRPAACSLARPLVSSALCTLSSTGGQSRRRRLARRARYFSTKYLGPNKLGAQFARPVRRQAGRILLSSLLEAQSNSRWPANLSCRTRVARSLGQRHASCCCCH